MRLICRFQISSTLDPPRRGLWRGFGCAQARLACQGVLRSGRVAVFLARGLLAVSGFLAARGWLGWRGFFAGRRGAALETRGIPASDPYLAPTFPYGFLSSV